MPQNGFCADSRCDQEMRRLFECHCCLQLICLNHLIEHDEKDRFHSLTQQLRIKIDTVQSSLANRVKLIERETILVERERKSLEQANQFLDGRHYSIGDIEKILKDFDQLIQANRSRNKSIVKIEPSLFDVTNCSSASQYVNHQDECSLQIVAFESESSIPLDLTQNSDAKEKGRTNEEMEYSTSLECSISMNLSDNSLQNSDEDEERIPDYRGVMGHCPLIFDGAYGLSQSKQSINLCSSGNHRPIRLYGHFKYIHKLRAIAAQRLIQAVAEDRNPITTKLFDAHEYIIHNSSRIECPFKRGLIHLFGCEKNKSIRRVPCAYQPILTPGLRSHLKKHHHLPNYLATKLAQHYKR